jgi:hypothetical protein
MSSLAALGAGSVMANREEPLEKKKEKEKKKTKKLNKNQKPITLSLLLFLFFLLGSSLNTHKF